MKSHARRGIVFNEEEIFGKGSPGRRGYSMPAGAPPDTDPASVLPKNAIRGKLEGFPNLSEPEVIRHYTRMSQWNFSVDTNMYPLGSCTMKHNPRINETVARLKGFVNTHPMQDDDDCQGWLKLVYDLERWLCEIVGLASATSQPTAGAHGEFTGMKIIRACLTKRGDPRGKVLLPDSAHGTNPASSALCGYKPVTIKSGPDGKTDMALLDKLMDDDVAALMLTNPNTLGIFESGIATAARLVHDRGGFVYCDGANLNALMGKARFGDMGVDVAHINLHKTFSTPHGGGGPGAGPVCVVKELAPFLPVPVITHDNGVYKRAYDRPDTIGRVHSFHGNAGVLIRAAAYIMSMGAQGLTQAAETAVLNANYVRARLKDHYHLPYPARNMHEVVLTDKIQNQHGVTTLDIAKALVDRGFHPPTIYFPLIAHGAIMIEPTETESLETLDDFCDAMIDIAQTAKTNPETLRRSPSITFVKRLDEAGAARRPRLKCDTCR